MEIIETKVKRWGNSLGIIIPSQTIERNKIKANESIKFIIVKDSKKTFDEMFGILKGRVKKSSQEIKNDLRRDLYKEQ